MAVPLIIISEIQEASDTTWTPAQTARGLFLLNGAIGTVRRVAPCVFLDGADGRDEARMIISEAILRGIAGSADIPESQTGGPFSVAYVDRAGKPTLTRADLDQLRALCGRSKPVRSIPLRIC